MAQKERLALIRQSVRENKKVVVSELSMEHNVTEETIRRDLEKLEQEGLLTRTYGGAVLNIEKISEHIDYLRRSQTNREEKVTIGKLAASVIPSNVAIGADASSTVMEAVNLLRDRADITVLTNSIKIVRELDQAAVNIIATGGIVNSSTFSMQGNIVRRTLKDYYVDIVLISCTALEAGGGVFDSNEEEAELKRLLIERGQKVILLADHTKFNKVAFVRVMDFGKLDMVITDREPSLEWQNVFKEKGVKLLCP
ncbi:MAG: DeoR/GlpR transcriptional regulator [Clostridiales bacterium]|nr:DeoR/GlpR transcriptional regulator [Clostridiales bacterium]